MNNISKIQKAIKFAIKTHEVYQKQLRKSSNVSYITHPLTVGLILSQVNADVDIVCAGILHDTIEDSIPEKKVTYEMIEERFGKRVADLVLSVSEKDKTLPWREGKANAVEEIKSFSKDSLLLKSADVISNVTEILENYKKNGDIVFKAFSAPEPKKENTMKHYLIVIETILGLWKENLLKKELESLSKKIINENDNSSC